MKQELKAPILQLRSFLKVLTQFWTLKQQQGQRKHWKSDKTNVSHQSKTEKQFSIWLMLQAKLLLTLVQEQQETRTTSANGCVTLIPM